MILETLGLGTRGITARHATSIHTCVNTRLLSDTPSNDAFHILPCLALIVGIYRQNLELTGRLIGSGSMGAPLCMTAAMIADQERLVFGDTKVGQCS